MTFKKIISGGQTGVDRAALDAAMSLGIEIGGWCPRGRKALDGVIPAKYPLTETRGKSYQTRTKWNVRDSDATLIICRDEPTGGTALTIKYCEQLGKPYMVYQLRCGETTWLDSPEEPYGIQYWLNCHHVRVLNVGGPREGKNCPVYDHACAFLVELFQLMQGSAKQDGCVYEPATSYLYEPAVALAASYPKNFNAFRLPMVTAGFMLAENMKSYGYSSVGISNR